MPTHEPKLILDCNAYREELEQLFAGITPHPYTEPNRFLEQAACAADRLPEAIRCGVYDFHRYGNHAGVLLLRGLPQEPDIDNIPTPQGQSDKASFISEKSLGVFGARLGEVFAYRQIEDGALFHNIVPKPGMETQQSSACSLVELLFHTEQHFHPHSPDYVLLYCLRQSPGAATFYASVRELEGRLAADTRARLFKPLFRSGVDYIFGNTDTERGNGPLVPVLYGNPDDPFLCYDQDLMVGTTPAAQQALVELQQALDEATDSVSLEPGDLLLVDNRRCVHGRRPFKAQFDGHDRWLQRAKVMRDLDRAAADLDSSGRVVETTFLLN